jgi:hypothetical protein
MNPNGRSTPLSKVPLIAMTNYHRMNLKTKIWNICLLRLAPDPKSRPLRDLKSNMLLRKPLSTISLLAVAFQVFLSTPTYASSERVSALGGSPEMLLDNSNIFIYPASAVEWPHFAVSLFENWGGALFPIGERQVFGLFFNRPTPQLKHLNAYIQSTGSDVFSQLDTRPWFDLSYARTLRSTLVLGTSASLAYDRRDIGQTASSALSVDWRVGLRLGSPTTGVLDFSLGLLARRLQDDTPPVRNRQTGGDGFNIATRYRWPLQPGLTLLPFASYERDTFALAPKTRSKHSAQLGIGIEMRPTPSVLVIAGVETRMIRDQALSPTQATLEDQALLAPTWVAAGQAQIGSLLFRLALRQENWLTNTQQLQSGQILEQRHFDSMLQTTLGLGIELGPVLLDGLFERDFFRDGPYFIGGSRHGGGIFSQLGITYHFASQRG